MAPPRSGKRSRETRLRAAEPSPGDIGWRYAERPPPGAGGVKEEAPQRSYCEPFVAMMQAADPWEGDDLELQRGAASDVAETAIEEIKQDLSYGPTLGEATAKDWEFCARWN